MNKSFILLSATLFVVMLSACVASVPSHEGKGKGLKARPFFPSGKY